MCFIMCKWRCKMATNLALDDKLIMEVLTVGHHKTKREDVTAAPTEYIIHKKQLNVLKVFGSVDFDRNYEYKKPRKR